MATKTKYTRNVLGLFDGVEYQYNEDGTVNWRSMISPEHLYVNKEWFERWEKPIPNTTKDLKDHQLLIKLGGIKELAKLRGFTSVTYPDITTSREGYCVVKCRIQWVPNFENPDGALFEDVANATFNNTSNFAEKFLEPIAANRAFVRCVRNFLNIHIVGADEVDGSKGKQVQSQESGQTRHGPIETLKKNLDMGDNDFEAFKGIVGGLITKNKFKSDSFEKWENWGDISSPDAVKLIKTLKLEQ